ncbi:unnamed protein product [Closterium sp. NIES-54]
MGGTNGMYGVYGMLFLLPPYQAPVPLPAKPAAQPSQSSGSGAKPSTAAAGKAAAAPAEASSAAAAPAAAPSTTAAPQGMRVVVLTNVKPGKVRDVVSAGLVLCASNEDHTVCRPLQPPEGAAIGEKITFAGVDGKPEEVLNPKKKLFEKLQPFLRTDGTGVAINLHPVTYFPQEHPAPEHFSPQPHLAPDAHFTPPVPPQAHPPPEQLSPQGQLAPDAHPPLPPPPQAHPAPEQRSPQLQLAPDAHFPPACPPHAQPAPEQPAPQQQLPPEVQVPALARPAATTAAAAARATAAAGGGAIGSAGSARGAVGAGAIRGGQRRSLPLPDDPTPQQLREWVLQRARPGGGGFCFLRTAQRRQQSQQETFAPQVLSKLFPQRCVTGSVEAAALGASESDAALGASEFAAALGASESAATLGARASPATGPSSAEALHTFTLDSGTSRCFFCDCTSLTKLAAPVPVSLADPTGGPVVARASTVLPFPAVSSDSLSDLHLPTFSTNLVSNAAIQDVWVDTFIPRGQRVAICTCSRTGRHLATFTRRPWSSLYTLTTAFAQVAEAGQVATSSQVTASSQLTASCSCRVLSHQNLHWHHRLGHPSLLRFRSMHSHLLVSGLPKSLPSLPHSPTPPCLACVEGRQRAAPHSSEFPPTTAPLQTLHMDIWGLAPRDFPILCLHSDRGNEFSSDLLPEFCRYEGIFQSFTLPASPKQNGIAECRIGLIMEVARTSMIHAAAPHFLWPFAVRYAAHQLNLWPRAFEPETSPTLRWTGKVDDASVFRVWGALSLVLDAKASKLSSRTLRCVFLGFPTDAPPWQFYHPRECRVFSSQDVTFDESICFYRLHSHLSHPGPALSGVSQVDPPLLVEPLEISSDSSGRAERGDPAADDTPATRRSPRLETPPGFPPRPSSPPPQPTAMDYGAETAGAEPRGAETEGEGYGGAATGGAVTGGAGSWGAATWGADSGGTASPSGGGAVGDHAGGSPGGGGYGSAGAGASSPGGTAGAGRTGGTSGGARGAASARGTRGAAGARGVGATSPRGATGAGGAGGAAGAGGTRGAVGAGGAEATSPRGATGAGGAGPTSPGGTAGAGGAGSAAGAGGAGAGGTRSAGAAGLGGAGARASTPVRARRVARPRPPAVLGTHGMALRPSSIPQRAVLLEPPASSLPHVPDPESDLARAASPTLTHLLATVVIDPDLESTAVFALVIELVDFAARSRLDYVASLVTQSESVCPSSVGGEPALSNPDALDIPTPRSYAKTIAGEYSSQWQTAMYVEMASWKSTGTYIDAVTPPWANIVDVMWIFRVKRPPGSAPAFKARYVARGFSQGQGVDFFYTFSPTPKMTTLRVLLHVAAQRDYELHSLEFSTTFLQGSLHEEIWLRRPPGFTGSFLVGTQWSLWRPVYGLRQAPPEWHDTLRTTLAALGFAPSSADPSLFLHTDTSRSPFYVLVYVDDLVFATADIEVPALVLQRFGFQFSSPQSTPLSTDHSLSAPLLDESIEPSDPCPKLVGCLITSGMGLVLGGRGSVVLTGNSDASWADDQVTQRSSQGYTFSLGSGATLADLPADRLGERSRSPPVLYVDNKAMLALCHEQRLEHRTRHISICYFLVRELQQRRQLRLSYVASRANTADVFTKALGSGDPQRFYTALGLVPTLPHLLVA